MKKIFISLITATLLFSACSSDDGQKPDGKLGSFTFDLAFEEANSNGEKAAALSTAIPVTSWSNIERVQMFLYEKATGNVVFSYEIQPSATNTTFPWSNIPVGDYDLALVANMKNSTKNNIATHVAGSAIEAVTDFNVRGRILNSQIFMDLKEITFPAGHTFEPAEKAYAPAPEVFTAYAENVSIVEGTPTNLGTLKLKRDVSLMRVRINKKANFLNETGKEVNFAHATNLIVVHRLPVGFGIKTPHTSPVFLGGILNQNSNEDRVMIGATGNTTFKTANPSATEYKNPVVIDADFTLWKDIIVLPNVLTTATMDISADAQNSRKYFVVISALAPAGYKLDDGTTLSAPAPVYWSGTINGGFTPNVIREVNLTIRSRGTTINPPGPTPEGGLIIEVQPPMDWHDNIQRTDQEV
jgi:hypothetical protein